MISVKKKKHAEQSTSTAASAEHPNLPKDVRDWLNEHFAEKRTAQESAKKALERITISLLSRAIEDSPLSRKFSHPKFALYHPGTSPIFHIRHYVQAMVLHR